MIAFHSHAVRRYNLFTAWALQPVYCLGPVLFRSYKIDPAAALAHALGVCNIAAKSDLLDQKSINRLTVPEEDRLKSSNCPDGVDQRYSFHPRSARKRRS